MIEIRKTLFFREVLRNTGLGALTDAETRVAAAAIFRNPLAGKAVSDLPELFQIGEQIGTAPLGELVAMLPAQPVSYGKAAIVGVAGEMEHGGACIHPSLGAPMRAASGGGLAVIPSNVKIGMPGTAIDLPLGHKDNPWSFDHFDTVTLMVADAPRPDEIVMLIAYADSGRLLSRFGAGAQPQRAS